MKKIIKIVLFLMFVLVVNVSAEVGFTYYIDDITGETYISGIVCDETPDTVVFPSEINGMKVSKLKNAVVVNSYGDVRFDPIDLKGAKHVVISEGITRLPGFYGVENLETVVLPKSLKTISFIYAFAGAKNLKSINLEWVEGMGAFAFEGCESLREVKLLSLKKHGFTPFNLIENLTIYGSKDSVAQIYAENNNLNFICVSEYEKNAHRLYELGLMKGTGVTENGILLFDLDRTPTRAEAVTMLVRFLGKEEAASKLEKTHPFTDVPAWADGYVSYAYENGLTNGMSTTMFGADTLATPEMYLTFMLRALGYTDSGESKDFSYENPWELDRKIGISPLDYEYETFTRADLVNISCATLYKQLKNQNMCLYEKMIADNVFTQEDFIHWMDLA